LGDYVFWTVWGAERHELVSRLVGVTAEPRGRTDEEDHPLTAELEQERELRARDRRMVLAEQRLDRVSKYSDGQKAAIKAVAKIAPALANSLQKDDPIITRTMVAEATGAKPATAGDHLKVFDLEGSPVPRKLKRYGRKDLTHYRPTTRDPVEIIERMAEIGEALDARPRAAASPVPHLPRGHRHHRQHRLRRLRRAPGTEARLSTERRPGQQHAEKPDVGEISHDPLRD
jgi:hypothetical protein